ADLAGGGFENLITSGLTLPADLALNASAGWLYWVDSGSGRLERAHLDGTARETLRTGLETPEALTLDVAGGWVYWTERGGALIRRADLTGQNVQTVVAIAFPGHGLALALRSPDCDGNGVPDECDLDAGAPDCNANGVPDGCELADGAADCNANAIPDDCEDDCDGNGVPDDCDLADGAPDCDGNGVPDGCEVVSGVSTDCNANGVLDLCDIAAGTSADCNGNSRPDECLRCSEADIVFIMDTSGTMLDEASALCSRILAIDAALTARGIDANLTLLGITAQPGAPFDCLDDTVLGLFGATVPGNGACGPLDAVVAPEGDQENWAPATALVAEYFNWRQNVARLIIPISDEAACQGSPCNQEDILAVANAVDVASVHGVKVSPIVAYNPTDFSCRYGLAQQLAMGTEGQVFLSFKPAEDLADGIVMLVDSACTGELDCNVNGIPDDCDIASGTEADCNTNALPDTCELAGNDCDSNGVPDECDADCNANGKVDGCEFAGESQVFWTDGLADSLQGQWLDGTNLLTVAAGQSIPRGVKLDRAAGRVYWIDDASNTLRRADYDGNNIEDVVTNGLNSPVDLALDLGAGKVYITDADRILRADLDGSNLQTFLSTGFCPGSLALDLADQRMYWANPCADVIRRARLDGTDVEDVVQVDTQDIALDLVRGKIYWTYLPGDVIQRANLDGTDVETVVAGVDVARQVALDASAGKVYWFDDGPDLLRRANLDGNDVETLLELSNQVHSIALDLPTSDCDGNAVPDECEEDCDGNGQPDACDLAGPAFPAGHALRFDGVAAHLLIPSALELRPANNFTIEVWINVAALGAPQQIVHHDDNGGGDDAYVLQVTADGHVLFAATNAHGFSAQSVVSSRLVTPGRWYHVAGVYDHAVLRVYVDGQETSKAAAGDVVYAGFDYVNIGRRGGSNSPDTAFFAGAIDELRFWNRVLSHAELQAGARVPLTGSEPGLVGYWKFDEGAGQAAADAVGGHDGALVNGPVWQVLPAGVLSGDCNGNGIPDTCETDTDADGVIDDCSACAGGAASGDTDGDGDVDLADYRRLEPCLAGPQGGAAPDCACFDFDGDRDVDLQDFAAFQVVGGG
ncbi:MAG TPA: hypothetical protein P5572_08070, partial [Phycisphaerae bacterium]|nr:hypothetical protein [Phycisphaerae bacterium]